MKKYNIVISVNNLSEIVKMRQVPDFEIEKRLAFDNPWWKTGAVEARFSEFPYRAYFADFYKLIARSTVQRAIVLMGPRRVGKTVMMHQAIQSLIDEGVSPLDVVHINIEAPVYTGLALEKLLGFFLKKENRESGATRYVFFDEIQYLKEWERHLKVLVDSYPSIRFIVSGSAAAALKQKSAESGAGRFTTFLLPPLTFFEFLKFRKTFGDFFLDANGAIINMDAIGGLNAEFVHYLNFGGFPEAIFNQEVRDQMDRFVAQDIVDKVLLRDLPSLYGISDTQELKHLFNVLAFNTGQEISLEELAKSSNIAKNTLRKYIEYLEAAFLIARIYRVDQNARRFKRMSHFKVYLMNPSLRAALYGAMSPDDDGFGFMVETAIASQLAQHRLFADVHYARWQDGEIDIVILNEQTQRPYCAMEIKWSDRIQRSPRDVVRSLIAFNKKTSIDEIIVGTKSVFGGLTYRGVEIKYVPVAYLAIGFVGAMVEDRALLDAKSFVERFAY